MPDGDSETIDRGVAEPAYRQLAAILRGRILDGRIRPDHVLPSENELMRDFGVSRNTSRAAIAVLRDEGLVVTVAGRGSYVVSAGELERWRRRAEQRG